MISDLKWKNFPNPQCGFDRDRSGSKSFYPGRVGSIFCCLGWVRPGQLSLVWVWIWKISPKNSKFINIFPIGSKNLFRLGQIVLGSRMVALILMESQKFDRVGSGQGQFLTFNDKKCCLAYSLKIQKLFKSEY